MDPKTKQETKAKVKGMWASIQDKADIASSKMRRDEGADIDVAIIKATLNDDVVPKEKHVRTLKEATAGSCPRQQVNYVIAGLGNRLEAGKDNWLMTLKTLVTFHRLMREVDPTFQEEMLKFGERTSTRRMLRMDAFADHTTKDTWDYSAWVRLYSVYLDERLDTFRTLKFDPENDKNTDALLKSCTSQQLLERLPVMHRLLSRLVACLPVGSATNNDVVIMSAGMVLREVRAVYKVVCEGIMNLADKFFEMNRNDAIRGLEIYRENVVLNDKLNNFFVGVNAIPAMKGQVQLPTLQALPPDFQSTLEEYVRDAPKTADAAAAAPSAASAAPTAASLLNTIKHGGATSAALGGSAQPVPVGAAPSSGMPPAVMAAPPGVSLQVGAPLAPGAAAPAPVAPPPPAAAGGVMDLLGADLSEMAVAPPAVGAAAAPAAAAAAAPMPPPPAAVAPQGSFGAAAPPPAAATGSGSFWGDNAFAAAPPPVAAPAAAAPAPVPAPAPAPAPTTTSPNNSVRPEIPLDLFAAPAPAPAPAPAAAAAAAAPYPGYGYPPAPAASAAAPPQPANPFGGAAAGFGAPVAVPQPAAMPAMPQPAAMPAPAPAAPAPAMPAPVASSNPFTDAASAAFAAPGAQPVAYAPPPQQQPAWSQNHDPLAGLGVDVFGKPTNTEPPKQSLNQMRGA